MSLELLGFRLLAPYFGYSIYVSASLLGLILAALAAGYLFGGFLGDKNIGFKGFSAIIFSGSAYLLVVSLSYENILEWLFRFSAAAGSLIGAFILFFVPIALLAGISPYFTKVLAREQNQGVGISSGSVLAVSTIGSLIGVFVTAFYLIPDSGVKFALYSNVILFFALVLLIAFKPKKIIIILVLTPLFLFQNQDFQDARLIHKTESAYSRLEVLDYGDFLGLRTDKRTPVIYSFYPKTTTANSLLYDLFGVSQFLNNAKTSLLLGLGAGTIPRIHQELGADLKTTGIELDPKVVELGFRYFHLAEILDLGIKIADARPFLLKDSQSYDLIEIDLFRGGPEIPFYLATQEFFESARKRLNPKGLIAMNIYDPSANKKILLPTANTISSVFKNVYYADAELGSYFVLASDEPVAFENLLRQKNLSERFRRAADVLRTQSVKIDFDPAAIVFTDNLSSLEKLSYQSFFSHAR